MNDIYSTSTLMDALKSLRASPRFFQDVLFPNVIMSDTEEVIFDVENDDLRVAPFVSPLVKGRAMTAEGFRTEKLKPGYIKVKHVLDQTAPIRRMAGEDVGGTMSASERDGLIVSQQLIKQRDMVGRTIEVMCATVLKTGTLTLSGEDYPEVFLDFNRDSELKIELTDTARWGESAGTPYNDVEEWMSKVGEKSGAAVDKVVMGAIAWKHFSADERTLKALDTTLGQTHLLDLGFTAGAPGTPMYKGHIGTVAFYVYNDSYKDTDGTLKTLIDAEGVILVASQAMLGTQGYGAIMDPQSGYVPTKIYAKSWLEQDPPLRYLMSQSAVIPFLGRTDAVCYAKVR